MEAFWNSWKNSEKNVVPFLAQFVPPNFAPINSNQVQRILQKI
jgi:hypothetical protein